MLPAQQGEEEGDEAWDGEDPGPPQPLSQEQILEEVEAAAAVEPLSDVQKVAFVRGKSILDAVKILHNRGRACSGGVAVQQHR